MPREEETEGAASAKLEVAAACLPPLYFAPVALRVREATRARLALVAQRRV
jgi:hypothetical protein